MQRATVAFMYVYNSCAHITPYLEIEGRVKTLDISHQQLYAEYQDSCSRLMVDDIKWGKIAVLLFFTSVLAKRLYEENKTPLIYSIVGWQTTFLHDFTQWILEHGGWVRNCYMCIYYYRITRILSW